MACLFSGWYDCASQLVLKQGDYVKMQEFNEDLSKWNVAKVTNMKSMFDMAFTFNSNLCGWNWDDGRYGYYKLDSMFYQSGCPNKNSPGRYNNNMCFDC